MKKIILSIIIILICIVLKANLITVPNDYPSIQQAINASSNGDTVVVMPGTYLENINFRGKNILLTSLFYVGNDTSYISSTTINGSQPTDSDTASCVIFNSGEDSTAVLQGFTIAGGQGTAWFDIHGAGVYREGGGVLIELSSPVVRFNRIISNYATNSTGLNGAGGGGIRIGDGNPKILNNVIAFNQGKYGPGIVLNYTGCVIKNNLICYNSGGQTFNGGGAIWTVANFGSVPKIIENNTIYGNHATVGTGGVLSQATNLIIQNNIIWANTSPNNSQIFLSGGTVNATYNNVQNGYAGSGNINVNPLFTDTTNFYLMALSPCTDAGDSSAIYNDIENILLPGFALYPSMGTIRNDMGVYGGQGAAVLGQGTVTETEEQILSFLIHDVKIFPNPAFEKFNVQIPMVIGRKSDVEKIELINIIGEKVMEVNFSSSENGVEVDAGKLNAGIYFVKIFFSHEISTKKIILE